FDCGLHTNEDASLFERSLKRETIDHGSEHAHVIGSGAIHSLMAGRQSAPDVSAADNDRDLHSELHDFLHARGDFVDNSWRNIFARAGFAHGFTAELEDDAFVSWF